MYAENGDATGAVSRRRFLGLVGAGAAGAVLPGVVGTGAGAKAVMKVGAQTIGAQTIGAQTIGAQTVAPGTAKGDGIFVLVTLYGGNDGLNTVIPYADSAYLAGRGDLAYRADQVLPLDASFGLQPNLVGLKQQWDRGRLAIVHGVGYPNPNRSHFRSMDIWQTGSPDAVVNTGWLGRWLDATGPDPLRMVNIGSSLPRAMVATKGSGAALNPGKLGLPGGSAIETLFSELVRPGAGAELGPLGARIAGSGSDLLRVNRSFGPILTGAAAAGGGSSNLEGGAAAQGTAGAVSSLQRDLDEVASLIVAGVPTRVFSVSLGGFDTHAAEKDQHARLMGVLDAALTNFTRRLDGSPSGAKVTVLVHSEFGRRVAANASNGTDHGTAAPVLVLGPQVRGGFHGDPPSLTTLDQGDLVFTVDFRSVYSSVLGSVLGIDPAAVLGRAVTPLALF